MTANQREGTSCGHATSVIIKIGHNTPGNQHTAVKNLPNRTASYKCCRNSKRKDICMQCPSCPPPRMSERAPDSRTSIPCFSRQEKKPRPGPIPLLGTGNRCPPREGLGLPGSRQRTAHRPLPTASPAEREGSPARLRAGQLEKNELRLETVALGTRLAGDPPAGLPPHLPDTS